MGKNDSKMRVFIQEVGYLGGMNIESVLPSCFRCIMRCLGSNE